MKTQTEWWKILTNCGVRQHVADRWSPVFASLVVPSTFSLGQSEIDDFCGNILHESNLLDSLEENLNYSVEALLAKFGRHRISAEDAARYGRTPKQRANQEAIANCIYGGAWGAKNLGNTQPGDGWKYRGRGVMQVTGRANYAALGKLMGMGLVDSPELLLNPINAMRASILWWEGNVPDAVMGNKKKIRKAVNGGDFGYEHVVALTDKVAAALA